ncbi:MAG: S8 family serine peptidase [Bacteroidales bacterium]|nr:S8 family serine peptidase [Bacteroidales bacterium]
MKKLLVFVTIIFCLIASNAFSQDSTYYYFNGSRETLYTINSCIVIEGSEQNIDSLENSVEYKNIISIDSYRMLINNNRIYRTKLFFNQDFSTNDYSAIIDTLKIRYNIKTRKCYRTKSYTEATVSDYFYVKLREASDSSQLIFFADTHNCTIVDNDPFMPLWYTLQINDSSTQTSIDLAKIFYESNFFDRSEPDLLSEGYLSSESYYGDQWGFADSTNGINVEKAWGITTGANVVVSVIDNGIELAHPDLSNNILSTSYDAMNRTNQTFIYGDTLTHIYSHGTNCAGIISAENNSYGVTGVAYDSKLLSVCSPTKFTDLLIRAYANGICWSYINGADVINCSWHANKSDYIADAIKDATALGRNGLGCIIVVATGNSQEEVHFPAICENTIAVGAIDEQSKRVNTWWKSCYGEKLDLVAPGVNIPTTDLTGTIGSNTGSTSDCSDVDYTKRFHGTSAACPHVSGVAALILSVNPSLTMPQVKEILSKSAQKIRQDLYSYTENDGIHSYGLWNEEVGYGLVDAYKSVVKAKYYDCYNYEPTILSNDINISVLLNQDAFGYGDITIKAGEIITLRSTLFLAPNSKIIIEPGAKLIIDGGTITSACDEYWNGIYVMGDKTLPQTMSNQGSIILSNGAVIENAKCAIHTWEENDWNTTGGIVQATNSTFRNNIRSIEFLSYRNHTSSDPNTEIDNVSFLKNCTFTWDDDMLTTMSENFTHVSMWEMKGIQIKGCTFKDERSVKDKVTTGINTNSSVFSVSEMLVVTSINNMTNQNSKFEDMIYGIRVGNTSENLPFTITNSEFKNNYAGVYATNANNLSITNTYFKVGANNVFLDATYSNKALGLVVESSTGFEIRNNNFQSSTNTQSSGTVGLQVKNSGAQSNLVSNNIFNKLQYGTQTTQVNSGLKYQCNNFTNCQYGIAALLLSTALGNQGNARSAATNIFSSNTLDLYADFSASYIYYYPSTSSAPSHSARVTTRSATPSISSCGIIGVVSGDFPVTPIFPNSMSLTSTLNETLTDVDELYLSLVAEYGNLYNVPENLLRTLAEHETKEGLKAKEVLFFKGLELSYHPIVLDVEDEIIDDDIEVENKMTITLNNVENEITISPNPAKEEITIESSYEIERIEISNTLGITQKSLNVKGNKIIIPISDLEKGTYLVSIRTSDGNYTKKIVKE